MKIAEDLLRQVADEPRARVPTSLVIVGAVLGLGLLVFAIFALYALKLAPNQIEAIWFASQGKPNQQLAPAQEGAVVTLVRHTCFGTCPAYRVSVNASGRVEFHGEANVCEVAQLVDGLTAVRFESMPSYTHEDVTDASSATITLRRHNTVHVVEHYHGDKAAPRLLNLIEDRIDEVSESSRWVGSRKEFKRECTLSDGSKRRITRLAPNNG